MATPRASPTTSPVSPSSTNTFVFDVWFAVPAVIIRLPWETESVVRLSCWLACWRLAIWPVAAARWAMSAVPSSPPAADPRALIFVVKRRDCRLQFGDLLVRRTDDRFVLARCTAALRKAR